MALSDEDVAELSDNLDSLCFMLGGVLVFFMQAGFALLEAGSVRAKNTKNILLKNTLDACLGTLVWFAWGFAFAFGADADDPNDFIGGTAFYFLEDVPYDAATQRTFFFQWAFAAAAATIVSGAVAERCNFTAYLIYTVYITGFVYPIVIYWGWSGSGWLYPSTDHLEGNGFLDFAGSGLVHMVGGGCGLMGAIALGPRLGRFREENGKWVTVDMPGHSSVLASLGTFILWFGWYGFNGVSTLTFGGMAVAIKVCVTTTLAAAAGGTMSFAIHCAITKVPDVGPALNGILGGLVSITAPCAFVEPWAAMFIGFIGGAIYYGSSAMLKMMRIDDPLDAAPVHFFCGMWGCISVGLFATKENIDASWGLIDEDAIGGFYGGDGSQLGVQIAGVLAIALWTCGMSGICFFGMKAAGILRVSQADELTGLDESHHGGAAYDFAK
jgi:Amt family ammonium transporter